MTTATTTSYEFKRLQRLYTAGFQSKFLETAVHKIIVHQTTRDENDLLHVNTDIDGYERQYNMDSATFWTQYQRGELDDTADFMEWHILCKSRQRIEKRLAILQSENHETEFMRVRKRTSSKVNCCH